MLHFTSWHFNYLHYGFIRRIKIELDFRKFSADIYSRHIVVAYADASFDRMHGHGVVNFIRSFAINPWNPKRKKKKEREKKKR